MSKRIAIVFIIVTLFYNALSYYLMFADQKEQEWVHKIENTKNINFKVIKLNASLYSFVEDTDFELVNENVTINHATYHIFKKRIQNNILSLYYLHNSNQVAVSQDLKDIVNNQLFNGSSSKESPVKKLMKSSLQDYIPSNAYCVGFSQKAFLPPTETIIMPNQALNSGYLFLSYSPPDFV